MIKNSTSIVVKCIYDLYLYVGTICYDDACHLLRYAQNVKRRDLTKTSRRISDLNIVVDRFHFRNHVDKWCQSNCNPYKCEGLEGVSENF